MDDELSPDGLTLVRWSVSDGRMSHVIRTPTIVDAAGGKTILKLGDGGFDATIVWAEHGGFDIDLRHYWRAGTLRLTVDRANATFRMAGADDTHPLGEIDDFVEAHFLAADREAMKKNPSAYSLEDRLEHQLRSGSRALWLALAIGVGVALWALFFRR